MAEVFGDAWFWIALLHPKEQDHERAKKLAEKIKGRKIVTSEMVLTEVLSHFSRSGEYWRKRVTEVVRKMPETEDIIVVEQSHGLFETALGEFDKYSDKNMGLVDCSSFVVMRNRGITEVLTGDSHFTEVGFVAVTT